MGRIVEWLTWLSHHHVVMYAVAVVLVMVIEGTLLGLITDLLLHWTGIRFGEYTDHHT